KDPKVGKTDKKRVAEETLLQESFKKLRTAQALGLESIQEHSAAELKELSEEDLNKMMEIIPVKEFKIERLVKEKYTSAELADDIEKALWVELKRIYELDKEDTLWRLQRYMHDPLTWRLYSSYAVHHVSSTRGHDIFMLIEKDYPLTTSVIELMLGRTLQVEEYMKLLLRKTSKVDWLIRPTLQLPEILLRTSQSMA
ncbi:hypothetical protein Tco_1126906, partial [Tanacetum coccineum]